MLTTRRSILCCLGTLIAVLPLGAADLASAAQQGPYAVETKLGEWIDDARDRRDVPWKAYLPKGLDGPAPVVVWSHGAGGSRDGAEYLGQHLASHGFAAFHIQHHGSDIEVLREKGVRDMLKAVSGVQVALQRMRDAPFAVDQIERLAREDLAGRIDPARIGISGHSYGAITTLIMAGQKPPGFGQRFAEPRFKAAFAMSPSRPRNGSPEEAFDQMLMPIFHLTGTNDESPMGDLTPEDRQKPFQIIDDVEQYLLVLDKGVHMTFSGRDAGYAELGKHHELIKLAAVVFWRAYLMDDAAAHEWLAGGGYQKAVGDAGRFEVKQ